MKLRLLSLLVLLFLASVVTNVAAQGGLEVLTLIENEESTYRFLSRYQPAVGDRPDHGTVSLEADPNLPLGWVLTYTPDTDYLGSDDMTLISFPIGFNVAFTRFDITVAKADIRARHDFATTATGVPITIDVTINDSVNVGGLSLVSVPVANAGVAAVAGDQVTFTPDAGFVGLTDFNYVICSEFGVCDLGTVSVNVLPGDDAPVQDTIQVFTKRGQPQFIFAPATAQAAAPPVSGSMIDLNGVMAYQPNDGFVGEEFLSYTTPGASAPTVYRVTVLDVATNFFAQEDRAYTTVGQPTNLNVLHNDVYDILADCVSFDAPRFGTLTETGRKGEVTYTPPAGWTGVDQFSYSSMAPGCAGTAEQQTVYVFVSNFAPASAEVELTASAGSTIDITYEAPGGNTNWTVVSAPASGTILTDQTTGQLSYTSNAAATSGTDQFVLEYCVEGDQPGACIFSQQVTVNIAVTDADPNACSDEECVWPGDTNNDGVVDVSDLLPIGQAMGAFGTPRLSGDASNWSAQYAEDWYSEINGLNFKHIDANGDQVISHLDTQIVMQNLGLRHRLQPAPIDFAPFDFSLSGPLTAEPGDLISLDIAAGNKDVIVIDLTGFLLPFAYDPTFVESSSVKVKFDEQSWLSYDSPILSVQDNEEENGRLEAALTRTSGSAASGYGRVGQVDVIVIDLTGFRETLGESEETDAPIITELGGGKSATIRNAAGHQSAVRVNPHQLTIQRKKPTDAGTFDPLVANDYLDGKLLAFPNPTAGSLTVHLNGQQRFSALQLTDLTGRVVRNEQGLDTNHRELALGDLPNGMYTLTITTRDGVVNRKIEVVR